MYIHEIYISMQTEKKLFSWKELNNDDVSIKLLKYQEKGNDKGAFIQEANQTRY